MELIDRNDVLIAINKMLNNTDYSTYGGAVRKDVLSDVKMQVLNLPTKFETDDTSDTIYISGAITGTDDYMSRFETAENDLKLQGYRVINPAKINANMPEDTGYEDYMKISMCLLDMCDSIYMLKGWQKSTGANREYGYALGRDMTIIKE